MIETNVSYMFEQVKKCIEVESNGIDDDGSVDVELMGNWLRLATGLFTARLHITSASCGENVDVYRMQFLTPMVGVEWTMTVNRLDGSVKVAQD